MAVRRYLTAGVAFAAAGAIVAIPAIAPPLAPRDVAVVNGARLQLSADITDLINTFFNESPGNADAAGTVGFPGVIHQLLLNANDGDTRAQDVLNAFFGSGASEVVRLLLTRDNTDQATIDQINAFFNGGVSDLVRLRLWLYASPEQRSYIDKFFNTALDDAGDPNFPQFGASGVFYKWLTGTGLSTDQQNSLDIFFNHGTPLMIPNPNDPTGPLIPGPLDENGEVVFVGSSNPALFGFSGLAYKGLKTSGLSSDQAQFVDDLFNGGFSEVVRHRLVQSTSDTTQQDTINQFFGGGVSEVVRARLLAGAGSDQRSMDLTNEFFDNGITGVIRYLLVGPVPTPVSTLAPENTLLRASSIAPADDPVDTTVDTTPAAKKSDPVVAAPAAAVAPVVAAADPAPAVVKTGEKSGGAEDVTDAVKDGNKVEVDPIIIPVGGKGAAKPGEGGFGIFGEVAGAIGRFITGTPAPATTTGGTETGGAAS
jgi:hypothetical protein